MMGILSWIILGGIAGWIASMIMDTNASMGAIANIIVGILGAVIGGFIMNFFNKAGVNDFNLYSLLVALLGSVVLLALLKLISKKA